MREAGVYRICSRRRRHGLPGKRPVSEPARDGIERGIRNLGRGRPLEHLGRTRRPDAGDARPEALQALLRLAGSGERSSRSTRSTWSAGCSRARSDPILRAPGQSRREERNRRPGCPVPVDRGDVVLATETAERLELAHVGSAGAKGTPQARDDRHRPVPPRPAAPASRRCASRRAQPRSSRRARRASVTTRSMLPSHASSRPGSSESPAESPVPS